MRLPAEVLIQFQNALPQARRWIDETLASHSRSAIPVSQLQFAGISKSFPKAFLDAAKVVTVMATPQMPLEQFGLPRQLAQAMPHADAITLKDTYFILEQFRDHEFMNFHELVHVAQWRRLGVDHFLMAYGVGLMTIGYENSPLEVMAYKLQTEFYRGKVWPNLVGLIEDDSDRIWNAVASSLPGYAAN